MSKSKKPTSNRLKLIRATVLSVSLLGFVPVFTQIRNDQAVTTDSTAPSATVSELTTAGSTVGSSITGQTTTSSQSATSSQSSVTRTRTRGS
jgi:hypothetical protein